MLEIKELEVTSKEWAIQARKFERSFEGKSTRRFISMEEFSLKNPEGNPFSNPSKNPI